MKTYTAPTSPLITLLFALTTPMYSISFSHETYQKFIDWSIGISTVFTVFQRARIILINKKIKPAEKPIRGILHTHTQKIKQYAEINNNEAYSDIEFPIPKDAHVSKIVIVTEPKSLHTALAGRTHLLPYVKFTFDKNKQEQTAAHKQLKKFFSDNECTDTVKHATSACITMYLKECAQELSFDLKKNNVDENFITELKRILHVDQKIATKIVTIILTAHESQQEIIHTLNKNILTTLYQQHAHYTLLFKTGMGTTSALLLYKLYQGK